jgi:multidrug efflux pump subunit AcrB
VVDRIHQALPILKASIPASVTIDEVADRSLPIRASVADVEFTLVLTIVLVVLTIFVFLLTVRVTVIPSLTLPLTLFGTFGAMYVLGFTLDNLSLMGLSIAVGFIVDDAIVMLENITRYVEQGEVPRAAALKGSGEIGFTIVSITVSLVAVFIPLLFMGGIVGRLFREFGLTVSIAILLSGLVSLTLTPMMAAQALRQHKAAHGRIYNVFERGFAGMLRFYERSLDWVLRWRFLTLLSFLATLVLTGVLFVVIPKGFFPEEDTGFIFGFTEAPQDISFPAMARRQAELAELVRQDPDVAAVASFLGATAGNAVNNGRMYIALKPLDQRRSRAPAIIQRLRPQLAGVPGAVMYLQAVPSIVFGGRLTRTQYQYSLTDADAGELSAWAPRIEARLRQLPELQDVASDQQNAGPRLVVTVDRAAAERLGVRAQAVDTALGSAFATPFVATIYSPANQYRVVLEVQPDFQQDPSALDHIYARSTAGGLVPLGAFAHLDTSAGPLSISHQGGLPAVTLSFNLAPRVALGQAQQAIARLEAALGAPPSLQRSYQGTAQVFQSSLASEPWLIAAALLVVYIVLGVLYESYIHPLTILSTLPSAGVGALLALLLLGYEFSVIALIGIILLIGIVKKNAIMMVDFALAFERTQGKDALASIRQAALLRFRPIMMTSVAAILGGVPLALASGMGSELRRPLGIAMVGGLLLSQVLTLYTTPVIYIYLDQLGPRLGQLRRRFRATPADRASAAAE